MGNRKDNEDNEYDILRRLLSEAIQSKDQINEDDLLTEEDKEKKIVIKDKDKPRRSCANCTCGRSEKKIVKKSSCGNCYKGDLFRCQGCPSYGLPAYEPGDVVSFDDEGEE
ncbi:Anamorsin [Nosema bombycis CQ1]|uniref:Anamorsin n=1 Tax=Nosema bombycis (strain CQ1 / CVCC 102059) TaxID=578461 RepID=R0MBV9_NOSB1|nr:Anamorsin [Nosema bombycis CQ1]|eukprot:EOB15429.1 Anamorsin [Nosema bombycis CQ1]